MLDRRRVGAVLVASTLFAMPINFVTGQQSAQAVTTCYASHEKRVVSFYPDAYREKAWCKQINAFDEVRGRLDMNGCCDKETNWFRDIYVDHFSAWAHGSWNRDSYETRSYA